MLKQRFVKDEQKGTLNSLDWFNRGLSSVSFKVFSKIVLLV